MTSKDRDYFMFRAEQETRAARCATNRQVRGRHEELAWLYQMRVQFFDRADSHEHWNGTRITSRSCTSTSLPRHVSSAAAGSSEQP